MVINGVCFRGEPLAGLCRSHGVSRLSVFGSILRDDFRAESDVDMLVEFMPSRIPTLISIAQLEDELGALIGRKVDLRTPREISRHFREKLIAQARLLHAA
ncbi:MAG: nucleotidyltransferase domain-containing protein [Phycisphaerae bacterium]|nr:nucleotidyltransferase domain-containing protein [Phycisphaerae bacterium]